MPLEVWGTYSVRDHLERRNLIADVLLYDRLVIPVPVEQDAARWEGSGWDPKKLMTTLEILGTDPSRREHLARPIPWTEDLRRRFEAERAAAAARFAAADAVGHDAQTIPVGIKQIEESRGAFDSRVNSLGITRLILTDTVSERDAAFVDFFGRHPDVYVDPVAAYPSGTAFSGEVAVRSLSSGPADSEEQLAGVFGWELFIPEDSARSGDDLLATAVDLARKESFRSARADFHEWRRKVLRFGIAPEGARVEMERLIDRYRDETSKVRAKTAVTYGFAIAAAAAGVAAVPMPPLGIAAAFFGLAAFAAEKLYPAGSPSAGTKPAAMFADARKQFGWE